MFRIGFLEDNILQFFLRNLLFRISFLEDKILQLFSQKLVIQNCFLLKFCFQNFVQTFFQLFWRHQIYDTSLGSQDIAMGIFCDGEEELSNLVVGCGAQHVKLEKPLRIQQDATKLKNATRWHQTTRTAPNIN